MDTIEIQLLAEHALKLTPEQTDTLIDKGEDYDTPLKECFGVDLDTFGKIAKALIPLTPIIQEPKSRQFMHAFVEFRDGCGTIIAGQAFYQAPTFDERIAL